MDEGSVYWLIEEKHIYNNLGCIVKCFILLVYYVWNDDQRFKIDVRSFEAKNEAFEFDY